MHRVHTDTLSKQEKRAIWDEVILDFLSSGKTMKSYAEHHGLRQDHLGYYVASYLLSLLQQPCHQVMRYA